MQTGLKAIDAMIPIGRGQRELIIGDRQTGKTAIAIDTIINNKDKDLICVYVAIGQRMATVVQHRRRRWRRTARWTTRSSSPPPPTRPRRSSSWRRTPAARWPSTSSTRAATRSASTTTSPSTPTRTARCRCCCAARRVARPTRATSSTCTPACWSAAVKLNDDLGGGSLTALPIIETQAGDVSAYIPTNVISITDGQIFLEPDLFYSGVRPAINVGISVSRVGGNAQTKAMKKVAGKLRLDLSQYRDLEAFAQFGSELDPETQKTLARGERLVEALNQNERSRSRSPSRWRRSTPAPAATSTGSRSSASREFLDDLRDRLCTREGRPARPDQPRPASSRTSTRRSSASAIAEMVDDFGPDFDERGQPARGGRVGPHQVRGGARQAAGPAASRRGRGCEAAEDGRRGGGRRPSSADHGHPEGRQEPHRVASRTSTRSRGRWRWWPRRGCAGPSSGSTQLRPYAQAIRQADPPGRRGRPDGRAPRAGARAARGRQARSAIVLVTGDRGLAAPSTPTSSATGCACSSELRERGRRAGLLGGRPQGRLGADLPQAGARAAPTSASPTGPAFANAREIGEELTAALRRRGGRPGRAGLQPLRLAADPVRLAPDAAAAAAGRGLRRGGRRGGADEAEDTEIEKAHQRAEWIYEPDPEELLASCSPGVREPLGLPGAARVRGLGARRADDGDAQRGRERRRR